MYCELKFTEYFLDRCFYCIWEESDTLWYCCIKKMNKIHSRLFIFSRPYRNSSFPLGFCLGTDVGQSNKVVARVCVCVCVCTGACCDGSTWLDKNSPLCCRTTIRRQHHSDPWNPRPPRGKFTPGDPDWRVERRYKHCHTSLDIVFFRNTA